MGEQRQGQNAQDDKNPKQSGQSGRQDQDSQQNVDRQQNQQGGQAGKTEKLADRAGGGSNKGSGLGSNEHIDQAGGRGTGGDGDQNS